MDITCILIWGYFLIAGTYGAWWMTGHNLSKKDKDEDLTLLDVLGHVFPALILFWVLFIMSLADKVKIKKR